MSYASPTYLFTRGKQVDPTPTVIGTVDVRDTRLAVIYVKNLDALQTISVTIQRRAYLADDFTEAQVFEEFTSIPPLTARCVDFDCAVHRELQVTAISSGVGCLADLSVNPDWGRR